MNAKGLFVKRRLCIVLLLAFSVAVLTLNVAYADVELIVNGGFELLAPYIGLVSLVISTVAVSAVYVKHRKKHACMLGRIMESIKR